MLLVKHAHTGRYVYINKAGEDLLDVQRENMIDKVTGEVFTENETQAILARDRAALTSGGLTIDEHIIRTPGGRLVDVVSKRVPILGTNEQAEYLMMLLDDVTERKRNEAQIAHLAHHDPLTDLPNRAAMATQLDGVLQKAAARNEQFSVLCIDLDRLKEINDLFGHLAGDIALMEVANRMKTAAGTGAFVSRLPADARCRVIVSRVIELAHELGLRVVAEGVETEEQRDFLAARGCDLLQGYLLYAAVAADNLADTVA
jgi:PAS domain S-box-containing protein